MIQQRANFDWMLKELADGVPGVEMIVVLSDMTCEPGRMGGMMRDLVVRIGAHLTSPPRRNGQTV